MWSWTRDNPSTRSSYIHTCRAQINDVSDSPARTFFYLRDSAAVHRRQHARPHICSASAWLLASFSHAFSFGAFQIVASPERSGREAGAGKGAGGRHGASAWEAASPMSVRGGRMRPEPSPSPLLPKPVASPANEAFAPPPVFEVPAVRRRPTNEESIPLPARATAEPATRPVTSVCRSILCTWRRISDR